MSGRAVKPGALGSAWGIRAELTLVVVVECLVVWEVVVSVQTNVDSCDGGSVYCAVRRGSTLVVFEELVLGLAKVLVVLVEMMG